MTSPLRPTHASRGQARVVWVLSGVWMAVWACAPPSTLPAPIPMAKGDGVLLGGGATVSLVPGEDCRIEDAAAFDTGIAYTPTCASVIDPRMDGSTWGVVPLSNRWAVGWQLGAGTTTPGMSGGVMGRYDFSRSERLLIGPQVELGLAWAAVGLPASVQVGDRLWVYTHPSVGIRMSGVGRIPVGVGLPLGSRLRLDLEGGVAYPYTPDFGLDADFRQGPRGWFGVGLNTTVGN